MAEETIRFATKDDRAAVLKLLLQCDNDSYSGFDYLAELYDRFQHDQSVLNFVAVIDKKVVGFISMQWARLDKAIVSLAKRVHREHQGQGIASRLDEEALKRTKKHWPEAELHTWSSLKVPYYEEKMKDPEWGVRCVTERQDMAFVITHENMKKLTSEKEMKQANAPLVKQLKWESAGKVIKENMDIEKLFPGKYITASHCWLPLKASTDILNSLRKEHIAYCSWDRKSRQCTGFSFGILMQKQSFKRYILNIHSLKDMADDLFLPHLLSHFQYISEINSKDDDVGVVVIAPSGSVSEKKWLELKGLIEKDQGNKFLLHMNSVIFEESIENAKVPSKVYYSL